MVSVLGVLLLMPRSDFPEAASLGGTVTDVNRNAIASASVSARNVFSGDTVVTKTDAEGAYLISGMRKGRYSVFAKAGGYGCVWVRTVFLFPGKTTKLDIVLPEGGKSLTEEPDEVCPQ
jgi:hypothetical protein